MDGGGLQRTQLAPDAVEETWLPLRGSGASGVQNLGAWLTTVVARGVPPKRSMEREQLMAVRDRSMTTSLDGSFPSLAEASPGCTPTALSTASGPLRPERTRVPGVGARTTLRFCIRGR